ncbi:histone H2B.2-like [Syzygium oleosum]|uniref:histone H2B.2-like n=1 Tax=Syzygium oleosum TaxID=219896 RepID=UPI0024BA8AFE|nr:histone H2B.2-like [Syzygium oleosum]
MAPKRKAKVVKTTRKVVQETVEVALVEKDQKLAAEAENGVEILQQESESEVVKTTVTVAGKLAEGAEQVTVEIPVEQPPQKVTAATTGAPRPPRQPERKAKGKTQDQKTTQEAEKKGREEQEVDDETQSPEDTPRAEAERETETLEEEPALDDGKREKAQETEKERRPEKTEKERSTKKDVEAKNKAKRAREVDQKARGGRRRWRRRRGVGEGGGEQQYKRYVFRVLKQVHPGLGISSAAMEVLNGYMNDMFERLAAEAVRLSSYAGIKTLSSRDIQGAVRLVLPGELGRHAIAEGAKAVTNYMEHGGGGGGGSGGGPSPSPRMFSFSSGSVVI